MKDPRIDRLAELLVTYSLKVQKNERVLIQSTNIEPYLIKAIISQVYKVGAMPFISLRDKSIERDLIMGSSEEQMKIRGEIELEEMKRMDCFIGFSSVRNQSAWADIPEEKMIYYSKQYFLPVHIEQRLNHTRWVVLRYPSAAFAQLSSMSEEAFENFFFDVCTLDYCKMSNAMDSLVSYMKKTDKVHILGPGTDLVFSIKGMPVIKCDGGCNIPDGEVYTAPVRNTVKGTITYNTQSLEAGTLFERIKFEFEDGRIIAADANYPDKINTILNTDGGARYVGEFAFGLNPYILHPIKETLFDEKIAGSIHFTPGNAYDNCDNGNKSAIHWDLVLIQRPEYGGGEIWCDDKLIRKDGLFVIPELECLNPMRLI